LSVTAPADGTAAAGECPTAGTTKSARPCGWRSSSRSTPTRFRAAPPRSRRRASARYERGGRVMKAFGDLPAAEATTAEVSKFLREYDRTGVSLRTMNKVRQMLSAIFNYARREDTFGLRPTRFRDRQAPRAAGGRARLLRARRDRGLGGCRGRRPAPEADPESRTRRDSCPLHGGRPGRRALPRTRGTVSSNRGRTDGMRLARPQCRRQCSTGSSCRTSLRRRHQTKPPLALGGDRRHLANGDAYGGPTGQHLGRGRPLSWT
jgi:hypothetical protein